MFVQTIGAAVQWGMSWPGAEVAREAEAAGVAAFTTGEFADTDAYLVTTEMALATTAAQIGPGIAYAFSRTPFAHAAAMRQLHKLAPGRIFLGLGSGAFTINRDWFGVEAERPVERLTDLVRAVKTWLDAENGQRVKYDGEFYRVDARVEAPVLGKLDAPVLLAAFNKRMAATAARHADGVIAHGLYTQSWWNDIVRPALATGSADREKRPLEYGWVITAVDDDDPARAIADARRMIAFYLTVKTYDPYVEHHGWQAPVEQLRAAFRNHDMKAMADAVTDEMLEATAVCGTSEQARQQLRARSDWLPRDVAFLAAPSFLVSPRRRAAYSRTALSILS